MLFLQINAMAVLKYYCFGNISITVRWFRMCVCEWIVKLLSDICLGKFHSFCQFSVSGTLARICTWGNQTLLSLDLPTPVAFGIWDYGLNIC